MATILVVDDEADVLDVIAFALEDAGYEVATAHNGRCGLEVMTDARPDLVLTDFMMPVMSGPEMVRAMRADGGRDTPVILMSAVPAVALNENPDFFVAAIQKPFRMGEIVKLVGDVIGAPR